MAYPVQGYRGGARAATAAVATAPGLSTWGPAPPRVPPWFKGGLGVAGRFAGAVGLAISVVELYRWSNKMRLAIQHHQMTAAGFSLYFQCPPNQGPLLGQTSGTSVTTGTPTCPGSFVAWGPWIGAPIPAAHRQVEIHAQPAILSPANRRRGQIWQRASGPAVADLRPRWIPIPRFVPLPVPIARTPVVAAYPEDSVGGQPAAVAPLIPATPRLIWAPTSLGPRRTVATVTRAIPNPDTREQKLRMSVGLGKLITLYNTYTEYRDVVNSFFKALPKECQQGMGPESPTGQKAAAIFECRGNMDWKQGILNMAFDSFMDEVWARVGLANVTLPYGANAPVNVALGKAFGDAISGGGENLEAAFNAGAKAIENYARGLAKNRA